MGYFVLVCVVGMLGESGLILHAHAFTVLFKYVCVMSLRCKSCISHGMTADGKYMNFAI